MIIAPFVLGFSDSDSGLTAFYIVVGAVVIALSLVTNYQDPRIDASEAASSYDRGRERRMPAAAGSARRPQ